MSLELFEQSIVRAASYIEADVLRIRTMFMNNCKIAHVISQHEGLMNSCKPFEISKLVKIETVELLEKIGSERHQAGLSQKERMENLSGTIVLKEGKDEFLKGKKILVIDDVFTTGSTLSECAKVLLSKRSAKPKSVLTYTFAKTKLFSSKNG
jgi:hypoxanthine-guanine phosphoribosyltransferase